ncbi:hypothetical protein SAMN05216387_107148 [Nitrosovibrio tenuis]|uniref:Uncharacterized protein n=2 Tax=Nitrosovibrio tenuis TaxID=1233 RepID=A0A1H7NWW9_9PROT|nr:hypothetical protein SAMN05216387_107148 [Nitrosovibrio tenuis]
MQKPVFAPGDFVVTPSQRVARVVHYYCENNAENFQKAELEYSDNRERVMLRASHLNFYSGKYPTEVPLVFRLPTGVIYADSCFFR